MIYFMTSIVLDKKKVLMDFLKETKLSKECWECGTDKIMSSNEWLTRLRAKTKST